MQLLAGCPKSDWVDALVIDAVEPEDSVSHGSFRGLTHSFGQFAICSASSLGF